MYIHLFYSALSEAKYKQAFLKIGLKALPDGFVTIENHQSACTPLIVSEWNDFNTRILILAGLSYNIISYK